MSRKVHSKYPIFIQERTHYRRGGLMVWAGISIGGRTNLHVIQNANFTTQSYAVKFLRPHVVHYAAALLKQDNARHHTVRLVKNFFEAETIQFMEWLACFVDLNPIEHVWGLSDDTLLQDNGLVL
ncbi:transposable element Tcb2 transposase [Trichonephila clavipes]|nr:transposable element Tcb2 transposase [Trichonephila clavipes]